MIRGQQIQVPLSPVINKNTDEIERVQIDMRNIRFTDSENGVKRPGYTSKWDTGAEYPVIELIPIGSGYAMDTNGTIFRLGSSVNQIYSSSTLSRRPQWVRDGDKIILVHGTVPIVIDNNNISPLSLNAPNGWFIASIGTYVIISGHNDTELKWSAPGNSSNWLDSGAGFANIEKTGKNLHMLEHRKRLYFFKQDEIEVWGFTGTSSPFRRQTGLTINVGLGAINSVVMTDDTFYWFGDDGAFYVFDGSNARRISDNFRADIDQMSNASELVGLHIRKEKLIEWISPHDGRTYIYDYSKGTWLEDNRWEGSGWQSMPFLSYMELNNKQYYGSRGMDGQIYEWGKDYKDDNGQPIRVYRRISIPLSDNNVRVNRALLRRKGGVATSSETSPAIDIRTRFDKGNWRIWENVSMGTEGQYNPYKKLHNLGIGHELEIEVAETDATDFLLTDIILTVERLRI